MSPVPADEPALRLAVAFVNTHDLLATPQDTLGPEQAARLAALHGRTDLAAGLGRAELADLRQLRGQLYQIFAAPTDSAKTEAVNAVLRDIGAHARVDGGRLTAVTTSTDPVRQLAVHCADALAQVITVGGPERLGTCAAHPCRCGFVDRTRAGRQRYCCQLCNDRMAAAAYRRRQS